MKLQFITLPAIYEIGSEKTEVEKELEVLFGNTDSDSLAEIQDTVFRVDMIGGYTSHDYILNGVNKKITLLWAFGYRYHIDLPYLKFQTIFKKAVEEFNKRELI